MKKVLKGLLIVVAMILGQQNSQAQDGWPKLIVTPDNTQIRIYQFQPESFTGNELKFLAAMSIVKAGAHEPVFGSFWSTAKLDVDHESRTVSISSVKITAIKIPSDTIKADRVLVKASLTSELPSATGAIALDDLLSSLADQSQASRLSDQISTAAPKFIYCSQPSVLVSIDGDPIIRKNKKWGLNQVVNSPFTIVQDENKLFYLYGGQKWYSASSALGPYTYLNSGISRKLKRVQKQILKNEPADQSAEKKIDDTVNSITPAIAVTTVPAELIEIDGGDPKYLPIEGTALLYVSNSPDDLFMDTKTNLFYFLVSGRWYQSLALNANSQWTFVPADKLPVDFAKIPEGSIKDNVLASVAGTKAAKQAVMDAQVPQTAKVDRRTATTKVLYDGAPQFASISGTRLQYAVNTSTTVLFDGSQYFTLNNGVWFISSNATGPWAVSTKRPDELSKIPPTVPVYNAQFVDIYDVTPEYVYMGYTPGYLNSFIVDQTLVYGTGFYYQPWISRNYYARPWSWGFDMTYNPWFGWGFGFNLGYGWFDDCLMADWDSWYGGWWGPSFYLPTCWGYARGYRPNSFYGRHPGFYSKTRIATGINIYRNRTGVIIRNNAFVRNTGRATGAKFSRATQETNVFSDRKGNVYRQDERGQWQNVNHDGGLTDKMPSDDLNKLRQMRENGRARAANFQRAQSFSRPVGGFHGFGGSIRGFQGAGFRGGRR